MTALTVHNAEIHTATVEIKTLTISGKQVTLAVFRQLPEKPLINDDGTLNGIPWGRVNYHPDKKGCDSLTRVHRYAHRHVVWQRGTELLRATQVYIGGYDPSPEYAAAFRALDDLPQLFIAV